MHDESSHHDDSSAEMLALIDRQRALLVLALEALDGLGFDLEDFAAATLD